MSAYAGLTAPQLLSLLAAKRMEEDALIAALTAAVGGVHVSAAKAGTKVAKGAKPAPAADSSSTSSGRSRTAWNAWVAQMKVLYPGEVQAFVAAKHGSPIEFASAKKTGDADRYARFVAAWKAAGMSADADSQAARAVLADDDEEEDDASSVASHTLSGAGEEVASDEEEATPPPPVLRKAGGGGGGSTKVGAAARAAPSAAAAPAPAPAPAGVLKAKAAAAPTVSLTASLAAAVAAAPKVKAAAKPAAKAISRWDAEDGQEYWKTPSNELWYVGVDEASGEETVGDWAGILNPVTGEIDSDATEPAVKPTPA